MCAQSPANFDLPSIKEIMGSLIFQQLEMVVMMMMAWNLPSSLCWRLSRFRRKKTLTKNLCLMLTNLVVVVLEFSSFGLMMVLMPGVERRYYQDLGKYLYLQFPAQRKLELQISCLRLIGDFPILYMIVKGQVMQIKVRLIRRNLMSRVLQAEILAKY